MIYFDKYIQMYCSDVLIELYWNYLANSVTLNNSIQL